MKNSDNSTPLSEKQHDAEIRDFTARVTHVERPSSSLLRVAVTLPGSGNNKNWQEPNVAVRFYLPDGTRVYTVRSYDPDSEEAVIDVVQHENPSLMMQWSAHAKIGDTFTLSGPRPHVGVPDTPRVALFADDTAIPALYTLLEQWPAGKTGSAWVTTPDEAAFNELPTVAGVDLNYLSPGESPLATAALGISEKDGLGVWAAGERDEMKAIRRYFRQIIGLDKSVVNVAGYWKIDTTNAQIDEHRRAAYLRGIEQGISLTDFDDLDLAI